MAAKVRFGFIAPPDRRRIAALEALPIDSLWVGGHVASSNATPEVMMQLAQLAGWTERVTIGTATLVLPLYPPAIIAKQVADLDRTSDGRVMLGVGVGGEYPQEFRACGVDIQERGARLDEAIPVLRGLWSGEPYTNEGRFFPMCGIQLLPAPRQGERLPIAVSGRQDAAMRRAATIGDGWLPYLYSPRRYAESVAVITEVAEAAGRDLAAFAWMAFIFVNIDDDRDRAKQDAAQFLGGNYRQDFAALLDHVAVAGTAADVVDWVRELIRAGARHLVFAPASRLRSDHIAHRVARDVIAPLRDEFPRPIPVSGKPIRNVATEGEHRDEPCRLPERGRSSRPAG